MDAITIEQNKSGKYVEVRADGSRKFLSAEEAQDYLRKQAFLGLVDADQFNMQRWGDCEEIKLFIDRVWHDIKEDTRLKGNTTKLKTHLKVILLNLAHAYHMSTRNQGWIKYSRHKGDYTLPERYNKLGIRYKQLIQLVDSLQDNGYIEHKKGFKDRSTNNAYYSRMAASAKLIGQINECGVTYAMCSVYPGSEIIILKDMHQSLVGYKEDSNVTALRQRLLSYNKFISNAHITLGDKRLPIFTHYRVFGFSRFNVHGRIYCPEYQNLSKDDRSKLKINGKDTAELDFKNMQPNMLYHLKQLTLDSDAYTVDGYDRDIVKSSMFTMINSKDRESARKGIQNIFNKNKGKTHTYSCEELMCALEGKHAHIKDSFYSCAGIFLMNDDSNIAMNIVDRFVAMNKPILTIHDSFIVESVHKRELESVMKEEYKKKFNYDIIVS